MQMRLRVVVLVMAALGLGVFMRPDGSQGRQPRIFTATEHLLSSPMHLHTPHADEGGDRLPQWDAMGSVEDLTYIPHNPVQEAEERARAAEGRKIRQDERGLLVAESPLGFRGLFDASGLTLVPQEGMEGEPWSVQYQAVSAGRRGALRPLFQTTPTSSDQQVRYERGDGITEIWENRDFGLEQTFMVEHRPAGDGALVIEGRLSGSLAAEERADHVAFQDTRGDVLVYNHLVVRDADRRTLPARMELEGSALRLLVDDEGARYPIEVDPVFTYAFGGDLEGWSTWTTGGYGLSRNTGDGQPAPCAFLSGDSSG